MSEGCEHRMVPMEAPPYRDGEAYTFRCVICGREMDLEPCAADEAKYVSDRDGTAIPWNR